LNLRSLSNKVDISDFYFYFFIFYFFFSNIFLTIFIENVFAYASSSTLPSFSSFLERSEFLAD